MRKEMKVGFSPSRFVGWTVWMIASIFYAYQYILRVMPNIMLDDIMHQFHISAATFGQFSGVYYIGYSLMHVPIGFMLDRFGPRKVMTGCVLLTVLGLVPLIFATHWIYPILGRIMIGIGSSAAILGVFKIVRMIFNEKRFARMLSLSVTIGLLGAIYGGGPVSYMLGVFGHHAVIEIFALLGVVLAGITYWIVPEVKNVEQTPMLSDIKAVLLNKKVFWSCVFAGLMVGPLEGFADVWGTSFLKTVYGMDHTLAASLPSMIFIGMCFGGPLLSLLAEKARNYLLTIVGAALVMSLVFFGLIAIHLPTVLISFSFVLVGVCSAYQILAIYKASTYVPERVAGLTTAVANMIIMLFGYAFHTVIGEIVNIAGGPNSAHALSLAISVIPIALLLGGSGYISFLIYEKKQGKISEKFVEGEIK